MQARIWLAGCVLLWHTIAGFAAERNTSDAVGLWRELEPAWDIVANQVARLVGEERQRRLIDLAYASVGANVCGLVLKSDEFQRAFNLFEDDLYRGRPEPQRKQYEQHLLVHYGTFVGLLTAEALLSREAFCGTAATIHASRTGAGAYWAERPSER